MSRRRYLLLAALILLGATALRVLWLRADPPTSLDIVWHDEGAWTHNARNMALWQTWRTDEWNPVFIAPVFTALEYAAFETFGVGLWQARTVPVASGLVALIFLMTGLARLAGPRAALVGGALLATEFTWVMWNRAALMESTMTAFMVVAWSAYAMAGRRPAWGLVAGVATTLAWFTKAAAAFFVAAIVLEAVMTIWLARRRGGIAATDTAADTRSAWWTLAGLALAGLAALVFFVWPHWTDYQFYNWQMTVVRKPSYDFASLIDRASWLPIVQDVFTRMWPLLIAAIVAMGGILARGREAAPAARLLVLWVVIGLAELTIHDSGNGRRYVMFIPALIALASLALTSGAPVLPARLAQASAGTRAAALPVLLLFGYLAFGSLVRAAFGDAVAAGEFAGAVRTSAALAALAAIVALVWWRRLVSRLAAVRVAGPAALLIVLASLVWHGAQYGRWASMRGELNYRASVALGALLPPDTLVHGKLANGLSLENRIRPVFVGRGFGNYDDRFERDDVRYILTYELPREGYESQPGLIAEILARYPQRRRVATFDVDETPDFDRAALIDKQPGLASQAASGLHRARD
jgi:hypothetical protein